MGSPSKSRGLPSPDGLSAVGEVCAACRAQVEGLAGFSELRLLELGSNRLREVQGLGHMTRLEELWLGRNRIPAIVGISECVPCLKP